MKLYLNPKQVAGPAKILFITIMKLGYNEKQVISKVSEAENQCKLHLL